MKNTPDEHTMVQPFKSLGSRSLRDVVPVVYAFMCAIPLLIFFACMVHYNLLHEPYILFALTGYLTCSLIGYAILRRMVVRVISLSSVSPPVDIIGKDGDDQNELTRLAMIFSDLIVRLEGTTSHLDKRMRELRSIGEITELTSRTADMKLLFETMLEKTMATLGVSRGMILSVSPDGNALKPDVSRGQPCLVAEHTRLPVDDTIAGRPVRERRAFVCADPVQEKHYNEANDAGFADGPFLALPIPARGAVIGVLVLSRGRYSAPFEEPEIQYATTTLSQAAFAFNNAQLVRELKTSCRELKQARDKIVTSERIAAINQTVVTLSDKINSPLTVIKGHVEIIRRLFNHDEAGVRRSLEMIETSVDRCVEIMIRLSKIQDHVVTPYPGGDTTMIDFDRCMNSTGSAAVEHPRDTGESRGTNPQ